MRPGFCGLLQTLFCAPLATSSSSKSRDAPPTHTSFANVQEMPPNPRPSGFVPPYLLKEITKSEACSPENQRAAAETLRHDQSRAMTPKSSQDKQDRRDRGAGSSTDGDGESGKSDDGMDGRSGGAQGTATRARSQNPFGKATEKSKQTGGN